MSLSSGPSGFYQAPLSKALVFGSASATVLSSLLNHRVAPVACAKLAALGAAATSSSSSSSSSLSLSRAPALLARFFFQQLLFANAGDLLVGVFALYSFRMFERMMGTAKYAAFVALALGFAAAWAVAGATLLPARVGVTELVAGPYVLLFACFSLYYALVPVTYRFRVFVLPASDKLFTYVVAAQLLLAHGASSAFLALGGVVFAAIYQSDTLPLHRVRFPRFVCSLCARTLLPLLASAPPPPLRLPGALGQNARRFQQRAAAMPGLAAAANAAASNFAHVRPPTSNHNGSNSGQQRQQQQQATATTMSPPPQQQAQPPRRAFAPADDEAHAHAVAARLAASTFVADAAHLAQLVSMGFSEAQATRALREANNNIEVATVLLLDG